MATEDHKSGKDAKGGKSALITIGDPPPVPKKWAFTANDREEVYEAKGKVIDREGTIMYVIGDDGLAQAGLIIVSDYWGYNSGRVRALADHLADSLCCVVAIPKLLSEPTLRGGTDEDGVSSDFDPDAEPDQLRTWLMNYLWATFESKMKTTAQYLRQVGAKRLGGVGFGFGSWIMCYTSVLCPDMVGMALVHPLASFVEQMYGGDPEVMASKILCPTIIMTCAECPETYKPHGEFFETIRRRHDVSHSVPFFNMTHGWMTRGDASKPGIRNGIESAVITLQKYLRNRVWPLPIGADADTLRRACQDGDNDMIEELIMLKLPVTGEDAYDGAGMSPIHYAARFGQVQPIVLLLQADADINTQGGASHESPLHCAARAGRNKATARLLSMKADVDIEDKGDQTPLHHAAFKGHRGVCRVLIAGNADIEAADTTGQRALHLAAWGGFNDIVQCFIEFRADIDAEDNRGQTPYMRAVQGGCTEASDTLDFEREKREHEAFEKAQEEAKEAALKARAEKEAALARGELGPQPTIGETGSKKSLFSMFADED